MIGTHTLSLVKILVGNVLRRGSILISLGCSFACLLGAIGNRLGTVRGALLLVATRSKSVAKGFCNVACLALHFLACFTNGVSSSLPIGVNHDVKIVVPIGVGVLHCFLVRFLLTAVAKGVGLSIFKPFRVVAIKL